MTDTDTANDTLYMLQMWLELRRLVELARALHLPLQQTDHNYITHCALRELFQEDAPDLFCVEDHSQRFLRVLAYSKLPADRLQTVARGFAGPMVFETCDWSRLAAKPMPTSFAAGTQLAFGLRACPVVRKSSAGKHHGAGVEVDAFLSKVWEVDDPDVPVDREQVYAEWLQDQLARRGGAEAISIRLKRFSLERMVRRTQGSGRKASVIKRPAATLTGELTVTDGPAFTELLQRGIGRHKSFGFGMLKVRRRGR